MFGKGVGLPKRAVGKGLKFSRKICFVRWSKNKKRNRKSPAGRKVPEKGNAL
jgi:hypothetical protein